MNADALRGAAGAQVEAQCKVNLRLKILAREASGFHQLETLFLRLQLADTVRLRRTTSARTLVSSGDVDPALLGPMERNLAWRAASAYFDAVGWRGGFAIELEKRIPVGGGLGGGSADAGAVLRILNAIAPAPLEQRELLSIAASLGADVPFLASEHAYALAWGRGERMLALEAPEARRVRLLIPPVAVNTAAAYGWLAAAREAGSATRNDAAAFDVDALRDWARLAEVATNDFEPVVGARHPMIAALVAGLRASPHELAMMSGSGSVVFAVWRRDGAAGAFDAAAFPGVDVRSIDTTTATGVEPVRALD